jgi:hypothetical protein
MKVSQIIAKENENQSKLEELILKYQAAHVAKDKAKIDEYFKEITNIYQPLNYTQFWYKQYHYLYDTADDFIQDYLVVFLKALKHWKPKHLRGNSRHENGSGKFMAYFWSILKYGYINKVKEASAGRRNAPEQCPHCNSWCNSLSAHILKKHSDLLWKRLAEKGYDIHELSECPLCISHKVKKSSQFEEKNAKLRKHMQAMHSSLIFEKFKELYPNHNTLNLRPLSVNTSNDDSEEISLYDTIAADSSIYDLLAQDLSPVQKNIITRILNGSKKAKYDSKIYDCTPEQFEQELADLQDKMSLCGLE